MHYLLLQRRTVKKIGSYDMTHVDEEWNQGAVDNSSYVYWRKDYEDKTISKLRISLTP